MPVKIKLMPDYGCWPLWLEEDLEDFDTEELAIQPETRFRLKRWAAVHDAMLNWDDPGNTPDWPPEVSHWFDQEGIALWRILREELGPEYEVSYYSIKDRQLFTDPAELPRD
jgi:hypothetical protein